MTLAMRRSSTSLARRWAPLLGGLLACACAPGKPEPVRPLEVVVSTELTTLDPRLATRALDMKVSRLVHAGLFGLSPETSLPVPLAAKSWSQQGNALTIELSPTARFHSGVPLRPEDVCATLRAVGGEELQSPHRTVVSSISDCRKLGPHSLRLELSQPRATLLTDLELPILREDQATLPLGTPELDGLGPFTVAHLDEGVVELIPADTGLGPRAAHALTLRTVRDENARALRLLAGRADVAPGSLSPSLLPALEGQGGLRVTARDGANVTYLLIHNERPPMDRRAVRLALAQALDRELLVKSLLAGRATVAAGLLPPGHWAASESAPIPFDPGAAQAVLRGMPPVTLLTSTERARTVAARAIAQMLGDAGLPVRVVPLDLGVMLERLNHGDFTLAILQIPELAEPNVLSWFFHPGAVPGGPVAGRNRAYYRSAEVGRLLDLASRSGDREERRRAYRDIESHLREDLPVIPLWHEQQFAVVSPRASAFVPSPDGRWGALAQLP